MSLVEWRYDATKSRPLCLLAHLPVAALGGLFAWSLGAILVIGVAGADLGTILFAVLFVLVGGPMSLLYLWPMLTDTDQRPRIEAFASDEMPFTRRSTGTAVVSGVVAIGVLVLAGASSQLLRTLVFLSVFVVVLVGVFSSKGRIEDGRLRNYGTTVHLSSIRDVRTVEVGGVVLAWVSYVRGTGILVPRLLTIPASDERRVLSALRSHETATVETNTDPVVRTVLVLTGLAFLAVAALVFITVDRGVYLRTYLSGIIGTIGALFCLVAWRGV
jgi:hypothetical protein